MSRPTGHGPDDDRPTDDGGLLADGADAEPEKEEDHPGLPPEGDDPMDGAAPSG